MPAAHAEDAPEQGVVSFKWSGYREAQASSGTPEVHRPGANGTRQPLAAISAASGGGIGQGGEYERIKVSTPSLYALVPLGRAWSVEGGATLDAVSGASPAYYSDMGGAGQMSDRRKAVDLKATRYFEHQSLSLGLAHSTETDYRSNALSLEGRWSSDDHNTTWNLGLGLNRDQIDPTNGVIAQGRKTVRELQLGVTQALNPRDLLQVQLGYSLATGYLSDPYKLADTRPDRRTAETLQLRWNHALERGALRAGYRWYHDSFGIDAHTLDLAWAMPAWGAWSLTPALRYYSQGAASFYVDPPPGFFYPGPAVVQPYFSADQRLSAFGALTVGGTLGWAVAPGWSADATLQLYRQSSGWRVGGTGSPGIVPLTALTVQLGVSHSF